MVRLTRAEQQERTRAAVLAAAREEFAEHGYGAAKVDRIADRAELTRGAVYSNFPGKRALYLAVLLDDVERAGTDPVPESSPDPAEALGAFARAWLERLPLSGDSPGGGHLRLRSLAGVLDDEPARTALAQVSRLEALLLALAVESRHSPRTGRRTWRVRRVRQAELVLTMLQGSGQLAETAPGFGDPFDVARACEHLAGLDLADAWDPPHLPYVAPARPTREAWAPPAPLMDQVSGRPVGLDADGPVVVLGTSRLEAAEEAVRAARRSDQVTVAVVTGQPAELGRLVRLRVGDLIGCLRRVFAPTDWPPLRLMIDDRAAVAAAVGVPDPGDATEYAVRVEGGEIVARAAGRGAAHAVTTAGRSSDAPHREAGP